MKTIGTGRITPWPWGLCSSLVVPPLDRTVPGLEQGLKPPHRRQGQATERKAALCMQHAKQSKQDCLHKAAPPS